MLWLFLFPVLASAARVAGETGLTPLCNDKLQKAAVTKALDSAASDRFRDLLTGYPKAKWKRKVWKNSGDLWAFVSKKKWIRFHIDPNHSLRELRPNVYLLTVELSRHRGKAAHEGALDGVSYEISIERQTDDCSIKQIKIVDMRRS